MVQVTVYDKKLKKRDMEALEQENLIHTLGRYGIYFDANCGGHARCRQCEVLVNGVRRRACQCIVKEKCTVVLPFSFDDKMNAVKADSKEASKHTDNQNSNCVCVDLGTTTIGFALVDEYGQIISQYGVENSQRAYGADVASRIQYASSKKGLNILRDTVIKDIKNGIEKLLETIGRKKEEMEVYVSGNTVMLHILNGFSPESIGHFPFTPKHKEAFCHYVEGIGNIHTLPSVSGYIGADVLAGAYYCRLQHKERPHLLLDLGTNGEMILGDRNHVMAASVAAGPAFEKMTRGAEALKLLHSLLKSGKIDSHGTLKDTVKAEAEEFKALDEDKEQTCTVKIKQKNGYITQDSIRALQLAKGAVRAGIEVLCHRFGCGEEDIEEVYIAGGFGFYMDMEDAFALSMLPKEFRGKTKTMGNLSLLSNVKCYKFENELNSFAEQVISIDLANDDNFSKLYVKYMDF